MNAEAAAFDPHEWTRQLLAHFRSPRYQPPLLPVIAVEIMALSQRILGPLHDGSDPLIARDGAPVSFFEFTETGEAVAFLAEAQLIEIEWELKRDGWGVDDQTFDGDFSEQGWPDVHYACVVDLIEMPDYNQLVEAKDASETDGDDDYIQDAGDQAFGALGMVWPVVKEAIEQSIRKSSCTVRWNIAQRKGKGNKKLDDPVCDEDELDCLTIMTFWTDPAKLDQLPSLGGEVTDEDDPSTDDGGGGGGGGSGRGGGQGTGKPGGEGSGSSSRIPTVGGGRGGIK